MPIPIPGCDCSDCRSARWRAAIYGESAVERRWREAISATRDQLQRRYAERPDDTLNKQRSAMASPFSNATFEIRIDPSMFSPSYFSGEKSMNPEHTPESLAAAVRSLADKDNNADLSGITKAVERANAERKGRIERALRGSADLAVMAGAKGKRFLITYWSNDTAHTAHGIEYPIEKRDSGGDPEGTNVLINDEGHPFWGKYASMTTLRKNLDDMKLTYHIAYFDN